MAKIRCLVERPLLRLHAMANFYRHGFGKNPLFAENPARNSIEALLLQCRTSRDSLNAPALLRDQPTVRVARQEP